MQEIEAPFYFLPSKTASYFHAVSPGLSDFVYVTLCRKWSRPFPVFMARSSLQTYRSALLNASYLVSRSHASAGSIKTNAPPEFIHDIMRKWVETHPVKIENVAKGSPAIKLLEKKMT